jgi:hypothetical protein
MKKHIYDWLAESSLNDAEYDAKKWLDQFTRPAIRKDDEWLARYTVFCDWRGKSYICSGASRLGDVWLKSKDSENFYDHRVDVDECSNWKRVTNPILKGDSQ